MILLIVVGGIAVISVVVSFALRPVSSAIGSVQVLSFLALAFGLFGWFVVMPDGMFVWYIGVGGIVWLATTMFRMKSAA